MKKQFLLVLFIISCIQASFSQSVYVTKAGKKYHKQQCRFLKYSKKVAPVKVSSKRKYAVQCSGKTKLKRRCRKRTKNKSNRCYIHQYQ